MNNRDCENCINHSESGCSVWSCEFEPRMTEIEIRADERENLIQEIKKLREASIMTNDYTRGFVKGLDFVIDMMKGGAEDTKVADLNPKCGSCKWLNKEKKTSVGYVCENPNKKWRTSIAHLKPKSCKACKEYEKKDY